MNTQSKTIIDVRSPLEFQGGHAEGAINIPLDTITNEAAEIKNMNQPIVLCCASGNRSGMAQAILQQAGIESYNAGPWFEAENFKI
ncbi:rhodanese-like domain-containing protein [Fulvivirga lutimaris]|uniref:rhodanese-like domain-containing protein n=1 Tax=Fulvivirga lutimaris TaxID=1819566 RepID=UPI0012BBB9C4|nr:rhodanese-like domain-containing protein [Fulvivirga lutimaris]MTI38132.1 rhodanese-like domain-containing protein [Fulvivirga lutimaris]